jgi:tetratricopeptide (TPR) repeat protein
MLADDFEGAIDAGREAIEMAREHRLEEIHAHALITVGTARYQSGDDEGKRDIERGLELALASNHLAAAARGYQNLSVAESDDAVRHLELVTASEQLSRRLGHLELARYSYASRAAELFSMGRWDEALALIDAFIADCDAGHAHYHESLMRRCRAWARLARDDVGAATEDTERSLVAARSAKDPQILHQTLGDAAAFYVRLGRTEQARRYAQELIAVDPDAARWTFGFLLAAEPLDLWEDVARAVASDRQGRRRDPMFTAMAERRFADAAEIAVSRTELEEAAELRVVAATVFVKDDRAAEAGAQLEHALAFYRSVGAARFIRETEEQLATIQSNVG